MIIQRYTGVIITIYSSMNDHHIMDSHKHHWHILGAGAIGTLLAFKLSQQQLAFTLIGRHADNESRHFTDLNGVPHHLLGVARESIDYLIICTKSTQALSAFSAIESRLHSQSVVICLFNGLGAQQMIQQRAGCPVLFATTTEGVTQVAPASYRYKGAGQTLVDAAILQHMQPAELPKLLRTVDDIEQRLMHKLIINSLINPLTALLDCENGQLLSSKPAMVAMRLLAEEIALWLATYRHRMPVEDVLKLAVDVIHLTANNSSSMRQDIKTHRVSEIDFINGYWLAHNPQNINLEHNRCVVEKLKDLQNTFGQVQT